MPRILVCYDCQTSHRLDDYEGDPEHDRELEHYADLHHHTDIPETARRGGQLYLVSTEDEEKLRADPMGNRSELMQQQAEQPAIAEYYKDQALKCFVRHGGPSYPGRPCIDYHDDSKKIGTAYEGKLGKTAQIYLCDLCPYEITVQEAKRGDR